MVNENWKQKKVEATHPCFDPATMMVMLSFDALEDAIASRDEYRSRTNLSVVEKWCTTCNVWHLFSGQGRGFTTSDLLLLRRQSVGREKRPRIDEPILRSRCLICKSSTGTPKVIFKSIEDAQKALDSLEVTDFDTQKAYFCPSGHGVHLRTKFAAGAIGDIKMWQGFNRTEFQVVTVAKRTPWQDAHITVRKPTVVQEVSHSNVSESRLEGKYIIKVVCQSCGYKLNTDARLKCAWCGKTGLGMT